jgi:hypothetical protein
MMKRRFETRTFEHLGETVEYTVVVFDRVEPCQDNPYAEGGRCRPEPRDVPPEPASRDACTAHSTRPGPRCLTKAQFVRAFQRSMEREGKPLPDSALRRRKLVADRVAAVRRRFEDLGLPLPRRLRRTLGPYREDDLAFAYDAGFLGRLAYHLRRHDNRRRAGQRRLLARLAATEGRAAPGSVGAAMAVRSR